ncbi:hypothetical protein ASF61_08275 [Duganella sp. Leaf126]|uniref:DUF945 family protein n=1 Tax=Duganella sp. Leaf126 TaxID=1736266 RepID=UPI0006FB459B|nr:DUF945 family protein [Duganella sp. Leaf126]KQQ36182.1 hypothetical protein ASF61_08275 [Duganella sp. Leaf126]
MVKHSLALSLAVSGLVGSPGVQAQQVQQVHQAQQVQQAQQAQQTQQQPVPAMLSSEIFKVYTAAAGELSVLNPEEPDINKRIAAYNKFSFSPELRPRLKAIFGTDKPLAPRRLPDSRGLQHYQSMLKAGSYQDQQVQLGWSDVVFNVDTTRAGNQARYTGTIAALNMAGPVNADVAGVRFAGRQARASDGLWYGAMNVDVDRIAFKDSTAPMLLEDLRIKTDLQRRGKFVDLAYGVSVRAAGVGENRVERANFAVRVLGLDAQVIRDFTRLAGAPQLQQLAPDARSEVMLRKLKDMGVAVLKRGIEVVIDDISAAWHGQVASLRGRIGFAGASEAELRSLPAILKKLLVRLEVRVPTPIVDALSAFAASKAVAPETPDRAQKLVAVQRQVYEKVMGDIRQSGMAVVGKDEITTVIEFKDSTLTMNGKRVSMFGLQDGKLPMPPAAPAKAE